MLRIVCFHLYNDYSGSPKVLSQVIEGLLQKGYKVDLYTSNTEGFLSNIEGVEYHMYSYKWTKSKFKTLFLLIYAQFYIFIKSFLYIKQKDIIFYINTICPVGAAVAAKCLKIPFIYHIHEKYVNPNILHRFYEFIWTHFSTHSIFVSEYLQKQYNIHKKTTYVVYNSLSVNFINQIRIKDKRFKSFNILMVCSLKKYKGIDQYVELAKKMPQYQFELVLNGSKVDIETYFKNVTIPFNLKIFPAQSSIHDFLYRADLLLNLSIPTMWIETFGLTLLEAMAYRIPVIGPPVGGPLELIENGYNGFCIDARDIVSLQDKISHIFKSDNYNKYSMNSYKKSLKFDFNRMIDSIEYVINII